MDFTDMELNIIGLILTVIMCFIGWVIKIKLSGAKLFGKLEIVDIRYNNNEQIEIVIKNNSQREIICNKIDINVKKIWTFTQPIYPLALMPTSANYPIEFDISTLPGPVPNSISHHSLKKDTSDKILFNPIVTGTSAYGFYFFLVNFNLKWDNKESGAKTTLIAVKAGTQSFESFTNVKDSTKKILAQTRDPHIIDILKTNKKNLYEIRQLNQSYRSIYTNEVISFAEDYIEDFNPVYFEM